MKELLNQISQKFKCKPRREIKPSDGTEVVWSSARKRWFSLCLAWAGVFTAQGQFSLFSSILGPYLRRMEPDINESWTAWVVVSFSFAQMISSPLFGWWSNKIRQCRLPTVVSLSIIIIGHVGYCTAEFFPMPYRKWALFWFRFLVGMGSGIPGLLRGYCATASTARERTAAVTGSTASLGLAVIVGPGITAAFAPLGQKGLSIGPFSIHAYNGPAVFAIVISIIQIILLYTIFLEEYPGLHVAPTKNNAETKEVDVLPPYDKLAVWGQVWQWFAMWITLINFIICGPGYSMVMFNWTQSQSIVYNGAIMAIFGVISLIIYIVYSIYGNRLQERDVIIVGMALMTLFSLITFPYPTYPKTPSINSTELYNMLHNGSLSNASFENTTSIVHGCDTTKFTWCFSIHHVPLILYLTTFVLLAVSFPAVNCAISTIVPKIIGPRRQGTWQGVLIGAGGVSRWLGPLALSYAFMAEGPPLSWGFAIAIGVSGIVVGLFMRSRYIPLVITPPADGLDPNRGILFYPK